ncbi:hypothetical protein JIX56_13455 [Streptomyces sp. CA-210063]|uniref:hypothetical protein n=1 Tax=Streptomyces sp. CA-210063 TaxID=2801029 RepID=UPI00214B4691|nr:hypothetical protein [Streptomyces sp. CA-210063]UUU30834.1 hypothetical protein JIX56_13455 [Streptomyces sp. CA-210063]
MPADEVTHGTSVGESRARSGPRHAAPKKPLLTRLNMPAGKAIALAAMPTAVLMGMGFTPTLARAEDPAKLSLTADEYKDCVEALEAAEEGTDTSASPTPTPTASTPESDDTPDDEPTDEQPTDEETSSDDSSTGDSASDDTSSDDSSSSDSGSDDKDTADDSTSTDTTDKNATDATATPSATASGSGSNVLDDIGNAIEDLFTPEDQETAGPTPSGSTSPSPSPSASQDASGSGEKTDSGSDSGKDAQDTAGDATDKVEDAAKDITDTAEDTEDEAKDTTDATSTPSPSASESTDTDGCPVATDDESGVEKGIPALPDDPWYLDASSLLLKGADYQGIVKVKTANGTVKEVLKYVVSDGSDIGDLHQTVKDKQAGVTYHVQAGKGTTSTIRDGRTVMYTESISGNLLGLIPVTFDPKHPPPLNIPLIYFTNVKVVQAGQFGGTLTVPGMRQYMTD